MKKMRIPLLIAWAVAAIGIVFGSFFDFQISSAIASSANGFALFVSAVGPTFGFAGVALMGGGFVALAIKGKYHIALKVLFYVLAAACLGVAIYYPAGEYFGVNGFYEMGVPEWAGYLVVILPESAAMVGGYFLFKDCQNKNMWIVFSIIVVLLLVALLGIIPALKDTMHRPRYRLLSRTDITFHNWWEPCNDYKELREAYNAHKDDFKSYPSGHTAEASILLVMSIFFPLANKKFEKYQLAMFLGSCGLTLLVAFARILAAAHFLSDVSFGAITILTLLLIANEVIMRIKPLQLKEEEPKEE